MVRRGPAPNHAGTGSCFAGLNERPWLRAFLARVSLAHGTVEGWSPGFATRSVDVTVTPGNGTRVALVLVPPPPTYSVTFAEFGMPDGIGWTVMFNGTNYVYPGGIAPTTDPSPTAPERSISVATTAPGSVITIPRLPNGTYDFVVEPWPNYTATPSSGVVGVHGVNLTLNISLQYTGPYVGLPPVVLDGVVGAVTVAFVGWAVLVIRSGPRKAR